MKNVASILSVLGLAALALTSAAGCNGARIAYVPSTAASLEAKSTAEDVEVLLDRAPEAPYVVAGDLYAHTGDNVASIDKMRERARSAGLDGIYWIDCASGFSGHCSAKGFVYTGKPRTDSLQIGNLAAGVSNRARTVH